MNDGRRVEGVLAALEPIGRRRFSLIEVIDAGRPAVYRPFGDALLYLDGTLFDVLQPGSPIELGLKVLLEDPHLERRAVGIEYGWRHESDCSCEFCALEDASRQLATGAEPAADMTGLVHALSASSQWLRCSRVSPA